MRGVWSKREINSHINYKESLSVKITLLSLYQNLENCEILMRIHETTALSYINKMSSVRFEKYNKLAKFIWQWVKSCNIWLKAPYMSSKMNVDAVGYHGN